MAKQLGIHQIRGKVEGRSYYTQRGVQGGLSRRISPNMSQLVKESESYATFRQFGIEWRNITRFGGALMNCLTERDRAIYSSLSAGRLNKLLYRDFPQHSYGWDDNAYQFTNEYGTKFLETTLERMNKVRMLIPVELTDNSDTEILYYNRNFWSDIHLRSHWTLAMRLNEYRALRKYGRLQIYITQCFIYSRGIQDEDGNYTLVYNTKIKQSTPRTITNLSQVYELKFNQDTRYILGEREMRSYEFGFHIDVIFVVPQRKYGSTWVDYNADAQFFVIAPEFNALADPSPTPPSNT